MTDANGKYVLYVVDFEPKDSCEVPAGSINPENYPVCMFEYWALCISFFCGKLLTPGP